RDEASYRSDAAAVTAPMRASVATSPRSRKRKIPTGQEPWQPRIRCHGGSADENLVGRLVIKLASSASALGAATSAARSNRQRLPRGGRRRGYAELLLYVGVLAGGARGLLAAAN